MSSNKPAVAIFGCFGLFVLLLLLLLMVAKESPYAAVVQLFLLLRALAITASRFAAHAWPEGLDLCCAACAPSCYSLSSCLIKLLLLEKANSDTSRLYFAFQAPVVA